MTEFALLFFGLIFLAPLLFIVLGVQVSIDAIPALLSGALLFVLFFGGIYLITYPLHRWLKKHKPVWHKFNTIFSAVFIYPPIAVILFAVYVMPFMLLTAITNNPIIGGSAFLIFSAVLLSLFIKKR